MYWCNLGDLAAIAGVITVTGPIVSPSPLTIYIFIYYIYIKNEITKPNRSQLPTTQKQLEVKIFFFGYISKKTSS